MSQSNVGNAQVYEAGDQRNLSDEEIKKMQEEARFHEGKENSHLANDAKDERSIKNKLEREEKREKEEEEKGTLEDQLRAKDATAPARAHGNEPSKGAKIDQQIREEEEEELRRKGKLN